MIGGYGICLASPWVLVGIAVGDTPALLGVAIIQGFFDPNPTLGFSFCFACLEFKLLFMWNKEKDE